jgi:hypothetical protein
MNPSYSAEAGTVWDNMVDASLFSTYPFSMPRYQNIAEVLNWGMFSFLVGVHLSLGLPVNSFQS